jgi:hypothetical protein
VWDPGILTKDRGAALLLTTSRDTWYPYSDTSEDLIVSPMLGAPSDLFWKNSHRRKRIVLFHSILCFVVEFYILQTFVSAVPRRVLSLVRGVPSAPIVDIPVSSCPCRIVLTHFGILDGRGDMRRVGERWYRCRRCIGGWVNRRITARKSLG